MNIRCFAAGILVAGWLSAPLSAQGDLTVEAILARARDHAPAVLAARARVDEARADLTTASARLREGPELSAAAGPRRSGGNTGADFAAGISQFIDAGGRRAPRLAAGQAAVDAALAEADAVSRDTMREAISLFHRVAAGLGLVDLLSRNVETAAEVERVASRRFALGDVAALDVNVARATRARAEADREVARADLLRRIGDLAGLLNWPEVAGTRIVRPTPELRDVDADRLAASLPARPDIAALAARRREAEAEQRLALASGRPDFGVSLEFDREDGSPALLAGMVVRLPAPGRARAQADAASARVARLRLEHEAALGAANAALSAAASAYRHHVTAARMLETDALAAAGENEQLARRSYEAGRISLADWLLYRREQLDAEREYLERRLQCALALIEINSIAGVLR